MELPYSIEELRQATHDTLAANEIGSCYVRPIAFRGYGELGINPLNCPVDVVIAVWPWGAYLGEEALTSGVRVTDVLVAPHRPEHGAGGGQGLRSVPQLAAREDRGAEGRLRRGDPAERAGLPRRRLGRERVRRARRRARRRRRPRRPACRASRARRSCGSRATWATRCSSATSCAPTCTTRTRCSSRAPPRRSRRSARSTTTRSAPARSRSASSRSSSPSRTGRSPLSDEYLDFPTVTPARS